MLLTLIIARGIAEVVVMVVLADVAIIMHRLAGANVVVTGLHTAQQRIGEHLPNLTALLHRLMRENAGTYCDDVPGPLIVLNAHADVALEKDRDEGSDDDHDCHEDGSEQWEFTEEKVHQCQSCRHTDDISVSIVVVVANTR